MRVFRCWVFALALCFPSVLASQQQPGMNRALDLERRGDYAAAVQAYKALLRSRPADASALLGLERSLLPLNRSSEMIPALRAALAAAPDNAAVYGIALRTWAAVGQLDSVRAIAERWARIAPGDESPYREWGAAELGAQDRAGARAAYVEGRRSLGKPDALAAELAQLAVAEGDYLRAVDEWLLASRRLPGYRLAALATLSQAPEQVRPAMLRVLDGNTDLPARRLEAELRARWGDPEGAVKVLTGSLPEDRVQAVAVLRGLLDQLQMIRTSESQRAQGKVLEALSTRATGAPAARLRLDAAQAYSAGGDRESARRMLAGLTDDRSAPAAVSSGAAATLIRVLVSEGKLDEAQRKLVEVRRGISEDEYDALRRALVVAWMRNGDLAHADSAVAADSSVDGLALAGRIRLYRGDIKGALDRFKAAGPYTGDRAEATLRTTLLALLQPLERDTLPELGRGLLLLEQGDTLQAASALEAVAGGLPPRQGGAEISLLAARLYTQAKHPADAERLLRVAAAPAAPGTAPAAELALGELLLATGRAGEAVDVLEHLILTYPQSALVPQARRTLDEARGAVPKT